MKSIFIYVSLLLCPVVSIGGWSEGVGGGDPMAAEFLELADKFQNFVEKNPSVMGRYRRKAMDIVEKKWRWSLSSTRERSLIIFVEDRPRDSYGIPKAAVYNRRTMEVQVHRSTWVSMPSRMKLELVVMELLGLINVDHNRYQFVTRVVKANADTILGAPKACMY